MLYIDELNMFDSNISGRDRPVRLPPLPPPLPRRQVPVPRTLRILSGHRGSLQNLRDGTQASHGQHV